MVSFSGSHQTLCVESRSTRTVAKPRSNGVAEYSLSRVLVSRTASPSESDTYQMSACPSVPMDVYRIADPSSVKAGWLS